MPVTIGPFTDVPAPGDPVASAWAQELTTFAVNNITIGPNAPTDANAELWYDTDDPGATVPNLPRGLVSYANGPTSDVAGFGTAGAEVSGMTVTWNAEAGRTYKTTMVIAVGLPSATAIISASILNASNSVQRACLISLAVNGYATVSAIDVFKASSTGSQTRKAHIGTNTGTASYIGAFGRHGLIIVEDISGT